MSINLEKGRSINLEKESGERLTNFCVGCNWGAVVSSTFFGLFKSTIDVDVDLSCLMFNAEGQPIDHIWSPLYRFGDNKVG
ncbi:MAG: TerD family protein, partial [Prevotellaceae bacterium]|nr:TerD family protein [Prevotellaceae bacterium]